MSLRKTIIAFITVNGNTPATGKIKGSTRLQDQFIGSGVKGDGIVQDPIQFIASVTGRTTDTIYLWLRQASSGVGTKQDQLEPVHAITLIWIAEQLLIDNEKPLADNPVRDYLMPLLLTHYKSLKKKWRKK